MNKLAKCAALAAVACAGVSCVTYTGVSKADGQLYISGATSYFIVTVPFIKRCDIDGTILKCEDLSETPPAPARRGGEAAPAAAAPGTAAPAPAPEPSAGTKKPAAGK